MKKKILFTTVIALALVCSFCLGAGAGASGTSQKITATIEPGIAVTVDGVPQQFLDVNGNRVYPIAYNGSTYLPLRAVCQDLAGFKVDWDQATRTAAIATKPAAEGVDLLDTMRAYDLKANTGESKHYMSSDKQTVTVNGYDLTHWLLCRTYGYRTDDIAWGSFNVEGKYDTVTFRYYATQDATLQVIGDNESVLWEKELNGGQLYQAETVNLLKTNQLTFKFSEHSQNISGYIYDAYLN